MKGVEILKSRYKLILGYTGVILLGVSIAMLTPLLTIPFFSYKKLEIFAFIVTAFFTAVIGFNLKKFVDKETNVTMSIQEGGIVVLLSWITTLILSALPFAIPELNPDKPDYSNISPVSTNLPQPVSPQNQNIADNKPRPNPNLYFSRKDPQYLSITPDAYNPHSTPFYNK